MKTILLASSNVHKRQEFAAMLEPLGYHVSDLQELKLTLAVEENGDTFAQNALIKARALHQISKQAVLSDDSGLCVNAMNGAPGVYSARFMGYDTDYRIKNEAIIAQVNQGRDRGAQFVCALAYIEENGREHVFQGVVEGEIADTICGAQGFGYDPIFYYPPFQTTLANVSEEQKNSVSHRARALAQFIDYLKEQTV
ncbi:MAG: RdgB/HAM1 family non-canonical purine NTP pyrophosphatase [Erysipelotrichaceae bacterium]|nr:RdgB/HAM1 family non-canonical purine NTP pyrophosphatase [Erysipelotrichaceae bacterium]MCI9311769.1 RdgB/HAM1 family non-canonical purine NTP pyrophosphatase [Erysipelotrichaceae bacterium]